MAFLHQLINVLNSYVGLLRTTLSSLWCGVTFLRQSLLTHRRQLLTLTQSINGQHQVFVCVDKSYMFQLTFTSLSDWSILVD